MNAEMHFQPRAQLPARRRQRSSSGFLYVAVLFTTLLVMVAVSAALSISTSNLRGETDRSSRGQAIRFAESEIHRLAAQMRTSAQWRSQSTHNVFSQWHSITLNGADITGTSQVRHRFTDIDGDLADNLSDSVELTVHAKVGRSQAAISVQLEPDPQPLSLLGYSVTAGKNIEFEPGGTLACERPVQVFDDCKSGGNGYLTTPRLDCSGAVEVTLRGDLSASAVTMPSNDVVAEYISLGTEIPYAAIPHAGSDLLIQDRILSPNENSFGVTDPSGIYWIDAHGDTVIISHCRFDATLAIRDANEIVIKGGITWSYPLMPDVILVTDSKILFQDVDANLDENARSVNFNPPSSPYRQSFFNNTTTDVYPSELRGVVYTSKNLRLDPLVAGASLPVTGLLVGDDIFIAGSMTVGQLDELRDNPPPGLANLIPMRFVRGTFRRIPSP